MKLSIKQWFLCLEWSLPSPWNRTDKNLSVLPRNQWPLGIGIAPWETHVHYGPACLCGPFFILPVSTYMWSLTWELFLPLWMPLCKGVCLMPETLISLFTSSRAISNGGSKPNSITRTTSVLMFRSWHLKPISYLVFHWLLFISQDLPGKDSLLLSHLKLINDPWKEEGMLR